MDFRQWSRWAKEQTIVADDNSVDTDAIQDAAVTLAKIENITADTILGRLTTDGVAQELTVAQVATLIASAVASELNITSGTYTPTLTNNTNLDSSTANEARYLRSGSIVFVTGSADVDATAAANTILEISLPISSTFSAGDQCGGAAHSSTSPDGAGIAANTSNNTANMIWAATTLTSHTMFYAFSYEVI